MNEEEIKEYLKRTDKLLDKLSGEDKDTLEWLIFGYNQCAKMLYKKENIIKEVREYVEENWISQKDADNYRFDDEELNIEISDIAVLFDVLDKDNK